MRKSINLEKGLFRIYTIMSLCGLICLGIAVYNGLSYKKNHAEHQKHLLSQSDYIDWLKNYNPDNRPWKYRSFSITMYDEYAEEKYGSEPRDLSGTSLEESGCPAEQRASRALRKLYDHACFYCGGLTAKHAKETAIFYVYLFLYISALPWVLHYIIKITFLPLSRWIIKGFKS